MTIACGPVGSGADGTSTTATSSTTGSPTTGVPASTGTQDTGPAEECLEAVHGGTLQAGEPQQLTCGVPELCADEGALVFRLEGVDAVMANYEDASAATTDDIERARCLATALRDRTPGQFIIHPRIGDDLLDGFGREVLGDLVVERWDRYICKLIFPEPVGCRVHERLRVLRPPAFFADCVEGDAFALWRCLLDAFEPEPVCVAGPLACP